MQLPTLAVFSIFFFFPPVFSQYVWCFFWSPAGRRCCHLSPCTCCTAPTKGDSYRGSSLGIGIGTGIYILQHITSRGIKVESKAQQCDWSDRRHGYSHSLSPWISYSTMFKTFYQKKRTWEECAALDWSAIGRKYTDRKVHREITLT